MAKAANQLELFTAASGRDMASFRDDIDLMSLPFFSISKTPRHEPIVHETQRDGRRAYIRVTAGEAGIASQWDADILMYLRTVLIDGMNRGEQPSNRIRFVVHDYLRSTGKSSGGSEYDQFLAALKRLQNTTVFTNITTTDEVVDQGFGWIQGFRFPRKRTASGADVMAYCEITLSDWLFSLMTVGRSISVDPAYFQITGGIERKLYLIARRHVGSKAVPFTINLTNLYERIGVQVPLRQFKHKLTKLIEAGTLPHYDVQLVTDLHEVGGKMRKRRDVKVVFRVKP